MNSIPKKITAVVQKFNQKKVGFFLLICLCCSNISFGQNKAIVLQNVWNNELNNYNPKEFIDKVYSLLKEKLAGWADLPLIIN